MTKPVFIPHEAAPHSALWTAWPSHPDLWEDELEPARTQMAAMIRALAAPEGAERILVLAQGAEAVESARAALGAAATVLEGEFGDIWLRDTGPVFAIRGRELVALAPRFNGWGGKYELPGDDLVSGQVAAHANARSLPVDLVIEGGALEFDGEGALLTTRECVLNPNRNPGLTETEAERILKAAFGVEKILWLDRGLLNDHTDGHIDNIARLLGNGRALCQSPAGPDDPQAERLNEVRAGLEALTDARGRRLEVLTIPAPGRVDRADGEPAPASHMNYVIGNGAIVVPTYDTPTAGAAVSAIAALFPGRRTVGVPATAVLSGGGAFHCVTQHQPRIEGEAKP